MRRAEQGRAALAASLALHAVALGWLVLAAGRLARPGPPPPEVRLDLARPPSLPDAVGRTAPAPAPSLGPAAHARAATLASAAAADVSPAPPAPAPPAAAASAAVASAAVASAAVAAAGGGTTGIDAGGGPGAAAGALRGLLGCAHAAALRLSEAERARCGARLAAGVRDAAPVDTIPAEKRAGFDAAVFAHSKMKGPAPVAFANLGDQFGLKERWAGPPGAHPPGFGCKLPLGKPRGWKSYRDRPPHSLKLGALPCFVTPPSGFATEEADVEPPPSLRERTDDRAHMRDLDPPRS